MQHEVLAYQNSKGVTASAFQKDFAGLCILLSSELHLTVGCDDQIQFTLSS
jgi:hypothetical protein